MMNKSIWVTQGEPAGVGPDLIVYLGQRTWRFPIVVVGDKGVLLERADQLGLMLQISDYHEALKKNDFQKGKIYLYSVPVAQQVFPGHLNSANVPQVLEILNVAGRACVDEIASAVVTAPIHKAIINQSGYAFSGHTEFFSDLAGGMQVVMMLLTEKMKMTLLTTHIPLSVVPSKITRENLQKTIKLIHQQLQYWFGITHPKIAVCGLNPHAGEGGYLGREELDIMIPALDELRKQGLLILGPLPADTVFLEEADVILAMYHDQGLPLLKYSGFSSAVNMTLGLPFIRTSVDHGTALSLAGTGRVDTGSMFAAIELAMSLVEKKEVS